MRTLVKIFTAVVHLVLADAIAKEAAFRFLRGGAPREVIGGFFNLAYVENRGCAWGLFQGHVWPLAVFGCAAMAFLIWRRREIFSLDSPAGAHRVTGAIAEVLLYAGILGNLIDRVFRGFVIDFFDFQFGDWHFPCFNPADAYITLAAAALIALSVFAAPKKGRVTA